MRPMPSPKGTNHEQLFLPDHFPLPNAGAAYDAALPRRTPRDRNEYSAPEEYEASIDILRDLLADYNLPPELIEGAVDRARRVIADRVRGAKYGAAAVRRSYDRHDRVTRDMPNPEAARGQEPLRSENLSAEARELAEDIARVRTNVTAYVASEHASSVRQPGDALAMDARNVAVKSFAEMFPHAERIRII